MKQQLYSLTLRLLAIAIFLFGVLVVVSNQGPTTAEACEYCVHLDPGSAIIYGCKQAEQGEEGSTSCWPTDQGCYISADYCFVGSNDDYCTANPWDSTCQAQCETDWWKPWCGSYM